MSRKRRGVASASRAPGDGPTASRGVPRRVRWMLAGCLAAGLAAGFAGGWMAGRRSALVAEEPSLDLMGEFRPGLAGEFQGSSAVVLAAGFLFEDYPDVLEDVVSGLWRDTTILALISKPGEEAAIRAFLKERAVPTAGMRFITCAMESVWIRDFGPLFVKGTDGTPLALDWDYAATDDEDDEDDGTDDNLPAILGAALGVEVVRVPARLEGGNILSNGEGLTFTSTMFVKRNEARGYDVEALGHMLHRHARCSRWIRLQRLLKEETGHVDMYLTLLAPDLALVGQCDSESDPENAKRLDGVAELLSTLMTSRGPMRVHRVPLLRGEDGTWKTYNNVLFGNRRLLLPSYADVPHETEAAVRRLYRTLLPDRQIAAVRCDALAVERGSLHCVSLNVPGFVDVAAGLRASAARHTPNVQR